MNLIAMLTSVALLWTAVPATLPTGDSSPRLHAWSSASSINAEGADGNELAVEVLDGGFFDAVDISVLESELSAGGLDLTSVHQDGAVVEIQTESTLGDGTVVEAGATVEIADRTVTLALDFADSADSAQYEIEIHELNEQEIAFTLVDPATGDAHYFSTAEGQGAAIAGAVIGIAIGVEILRALLVLGAVIVVVGVVWIAASEAISSIRRSPQGFNHYAALISSGTLYISEGLTFTRATQRIQGNLNTWSTSESGARSVCQQASNGRKPTGPEIDLRGSGKYNHFHRSTRSSAHCFYGSARP